MADYDECPNPACGREANDAVSSNWFPVYTCNDCDTKFCEECGPSGCPECDSQNYSDNDDKVYYREE